MKHGRGEDAISEVVGFVVILAILVAAMSLYLTHAVPVQGREGEIEVMDGVRAWFVDYKTSADQLWLNSPEDPGSQLFEPTIGNVSVRRVIDPGTTRERGFVGRYLPLLVPIPASAQVSIRTGDTLQITGWRGADELSIGSFAAPAIVYTSHNNYWLQQEYSYQLGGVFLRQWNLQGDEPERMTVIAAPSLSIYASEEGTGYQTKICLVVVNMTPPKVGFGGMSPVRIETNLLTNPHSLIPNGGSLAAGFTRVTLTFSGSSHESAMAWSRVFTGAAVRNRLNYQYYQIHTPLPGETTTWIDIDGNEPASSATKDVWLEGLVADYSLRMENVPSMIQ